MKITVNEERGKIKIEQLNVGDCFTVGETLANTRKIWMVVEINQEKTFVNLMSGRIAPPTEEHPSEVLPINVELVISKKHYLSS